MKRNWWKSRIVFLGKINIYSFVKRLLKPQETCNVIARKRVELCEETARCFLNYEMLVTNQSHDHIVGHLSSDYYFFWVFFLDRCKDPAHQNLIYAWATPIRNVWEGQNQ